MPVHTITEAQIRAIAPSTYERGWEYYYDDAVIDVIQRGADLVAQVQGSDYEPYRVHVRLGADGVESWECSCPYDWGGACKHVAAVLLTYLHRADQIEARPPLQDLLGNLDAEDLRQVIVHLVARQPALASEVEQAVQSLTTLQAATPEQGAALSLLDQDRLEMLLSSTTPQPEALARMFAPYVEAGQGAALLQALARITEHYVHRWLADEGYYDEAGDYLYVLDDYWATALLCVDLPAGERRRWSDRLRRWQEQVEDYGFDDLFVTAHTAAKEGWDDPQITRALRGDLSTGAALYDELPDYDPDLIDIRLQILEHREQTEEYLNLAQASGVWSAYATMLVRLGRIDEATNVALQRLATHAEALQVAQALYDSNAVEQALQIAEHGLTLHGTSQIERWIKVGGIAFQAPSAMGKTSLARWLRDRAQEHGHTERALAAALVAVHSSAELADYQAVQALAGERWPTLRDDLIRHLRDLGSYDQISGKVDIFLHEGLYDDAIAAVEANPGMYEMAETVADQVIQHRPNWVIGYSQRQAARIIAAAKADRYAYAVHWLQRARDAARVAGKEAAWRDHMRQMIDAHRRKYKLVPMLEDLLRRKD